MGEMHFLALKIHSNFNFGIKILNIFLSPYSLSSYMGKISTTSYCSPSAAETLKWLTIGASTLLGLTSRGAQIFQRCVPELVFFFCFFSFFDKWLVGFKFEIGQSDVAPSLFPIHKCRWPLRMALWGLVAFFLQMRSLTLAFSCLGLGFIWQALKNFGRHIGNIWNLWSS